MNILDLFTAKTQRNITYLYWGLFTEALNALIFLPRPLDETIRTILIGVISVLGTLATQQSTYWFARQRPLSVPDPATTTTQTTITTTPSPDLPSPPL